MVEGRSISKPFALSLSKGRSSFSTPRPKKKRCFDKLSTNGEGG
jgi:hypothetical protein